MAWKVQTVQFFLVLTAGCVLENAKWDYNFYPKAKFMRKLSKRSTREVFLRWSPAAVLMGVMYIASDTPARKIPRFSEVDEPVKKLGHAIGYGLLALAYLRGIGSHRRYAKGKAVLFSFMYALSDEYHQGKTAGRTPSWADVGIDTASAALAIFLYSHSQRLRVLTDALL